MVTHWSEAESKKEAPGNDSTVFWYSKLKAEEVNKPATLETVLNAVNIWPNSLGSTHLVAKESSEVIIMGPKMVRTAP